MLLNAFKEMMTMVAESPAKLFYAELKQKTDQELCDLIEQMVTDPGWNEQVEKTTKAELLKAVVVRRFFERVMGESANRPNSERLQKGSD